MPQLLIIKQGGAATVRKADVVKDFLGNRSSAVSAVRADVRRKPLVQHLPPLLGRTLVTRFRNSGKIQGTVSEGGLYGIVRRGEGNEP